MRKAVLSLLSGVAMIGMIAAAQADVEFGIFDADRDNLVSTVEFGVGLDNAAYFEGDEGFFGIFDANDDGFLGLGEIEDRDEAYFGAYDLNRDGLIDRAEYYGGLFDRYDANDDGFLGMDEWGLFDAGFDII